MDYKRMIDKELRALTCYYTPCGGDVGISGGGFSSKPFRCSDSEMLRIPARAHIAAHWRQLSRERRFK